MLLLSGNETWESKAPAAHCWGPSDALGASSVCLLLGCAMKGGSWLVISKRGHSVPSPSLPLWFLKPSSLATHSRKPGNLLKGAVDGAFFMSTGPFVSKVTSKSNNDYWRKYVNTLYRYVLHTAWKLCSEFGHRDCWMKESTTLCKYYENNCYRGTSLWWKMKGIRAAKFSPEWWGIDSGFSAWYQKIQSLTDAPWGAHRKPTSVRNTMCDLSGCDKQCHH